MNINSSNFKALAEMFNKDNRSFSINDYVWLSAVNPGATRGHKLIIFPFTRFSFTIPVNINDGDYICSKLEKMGVRPEY